MPKIYLSPSTQEYNIYFNDEKSEEYYMNRIADEMVPYLNASGIEFKRNTPDMTAATSIKASNLGHYDLHLALHSNASGDGKEEGKRRGTEVYYYPTSEKGQRAAEIIANNFKLIYPLPQNVITVPTETLGEISKTKAPAVLIEYAFHDNSADSDFIKNNIKEIAENTVLSLTDYFDIPFIPPAEVKTGIVSTSGARLNIRAKPSVNAFVKGKIPNGAKVTVYSSYDGWYVVKYKGIVGYSSSKYIKI